MISKFGITHNQEGKKILVVPKITVDQKTVTLEDFAQIGLTDQIQETIPTDRETRFVFSLPDGWREEIAQDVPGDGKNARGLAGRLRDYAFIFNHIGQHVVEIAIFDDYLTPEAFVTVYNPGQHKAAKT